MNNWINHVKSFANDNEMTYNEALRHPDCKQTYHTGGNARPYQIVSALIAKGKFDLSKMRKAPSDYLKRQYNNKITESLNNDLKKDVYSRNKWINFVKTYAMNNNMTYSEALKDRNCKIGYRNTLI